MPRTTSVLAVIAATVFLAASPVTAAEAESGVRLEYAVPADTTVEDVERAVSVLRQRLWDLEPRGGSVADEDGAIVVSFPSDIASTEEAAAFARRLAVRGDVRFVPVEAACAGEVEVGAPAPGCLTATEPIFHGTGIYDAHVGIDPQTGEVSVDVELDGGATDRFDAYAEAHYLESFAIVLDGIVASAPIIMATRYGGQATITGDFTEEEAAALAAASRSGALPVELELREARFEDVVPSEVERPPALPSFRTDGLEWTVFGLADTIGAFGIDDFVAVLQPEDGTIALTILTDDPEVPAVVAEVLGESGLPADVTIAYHAGPAAAFLETVPTRSIPLELADEFPHGMAWLPEQGAIVGDAASLDPQAAPGQRRVDVELARGRLREARAAEAEWEAVTQLPGFGGFTIEYDPSAMLDDVTGNLEDVPGVLVVGFKGGVPAGVLERLRAHIDTFAWSSGIERIVGDDVEFTRAELETMKETVDQMAVEHGVQAQTFILYQSTATSQSVVDGETPDMTELTDRELGPFDQWISIWPVVDEGFDDAAWQSFKDAVEERLPEGALDPTDPTS